MRAHLGGAEDRPDLGRELAQPLGGGTELADPGPSPSASASVACANRCRLSPTLGLRHGASPLRGRASVLAQPRAERCDRTHRRADVRQAPWPMCSSATPARTGRSPRGSRTRWRPVGGRVVGSRDPAGQGLRRADRGRAGAGQGRGGDLVAGLGQVGLGARRGARGAGARRAGAGAGRRHRAADRLPLDPLRSTSPAGSGGAHPGLADLELADRLPAHRPAGAGSRRAGARADRRRSHGRRGCAGRPWRLWHLARCGRRRWPCCRRWCSGATIPTGRRYRTAATMPT